MFLANLQRYFWIALAASLIASAPMAQTFPSATAYLVSSFPAGGTTDFAARVIQAEYGKRLGQSVVVENVTGASGSLGARKVLAAPADGHTQLVGSPADLIFPPMLIKSVKHKPEDFRLVNLIAGSGLALLIRKDIPANNLEEFLVWANGRKVTYASAGLGSPFHVITAKFGKMAGVNLIHVPYKGGGELLGALMAGNVDMAFWTLSPNVISTVNSGGYRAIGIAQPQTNPLLPSAPPLGHHKLLPDFNFVAWVGIFVPKATPESVVATIHKAMREVLTDPVVRKRIIDAALDIFPPMTLAENEIFWKQQIGLFQEVIKAEGLQAQ